MSGQGAVTNPFVDFRHDLDLYHRAMTVGMSDGQYVELVGVLDDRVRSVAGTGFVTTPFVLLDLPEAVREVWAKVETGGVGGSHKARHLFGLLLVDEIARRATDGTGGGGPKAKLAIASCGNAALAAAVVARAGDRALEVFVPTDADPLVLERLTELGAGVTVCPRRPDELGDPCVARLSEAVGAGAQPFTVQGTTCPDAFDGARTLGLELAVQTVAAWAGVGHGAFDLYIQIGGGALAVATMDGLSRAASRLEGGDLHVPEPRLHPVQARRAHPFVAAWERLVPRLVEAAGLAGAAASTDADDPMARGARLQPAARAGRLDDVVEAATDVMLPWPVPPASAATGILDDVTYDWQPLVSHQLRSAGWPVLVGEAELVSAAARAAQLVSPPPDATGAAGLAGSLADPASVSDRPAVVILSGIDRAWERQAHRS